MHVSRSMVLARSLGGYLPVSYILHRRVTGVIRFQAARRLPGMRPQRHSCPGPQTYYLDVLAAVTNERRVYQDQHRREGDPRAEKSFYGCRLCKLRSSR